MRALTAAIIAAALATPAGAFQTTPGNDVTPLDGSSFEVTWRGTGGGSAFWCAAGEYAIEGMGLSGDTLIYRYTPPVRQPGEGIVFGLDPARAVNPGLLRLGTSEGLSAAYARTLCQQYRR